MRNTSYLSFLEPSKPINKGNLSLIFTDINLQKSTKNKRNQSITTSATSISNSKINNPIKNKIDKNLLKK